MEDKRLRFKDIHKLTGIPRSEYAKRLKRSRINPRSLQYEDGRIIGKDNFGQEKLLVMERWQDGRYAPVWVFTRKDTLESYLEYRRRVPTAGSDVWEESNYECTYVFGTEQKG